MSCFSPFRIAIVLFGVLWLAMSNLAYALDRVSLQLRWDHQFQFAGYYVAQWKGYYLEEGIDVEIRSAVTADGIKSATQEVADGRADFGVGAADILIANDQGANLMVVAPIFQTSAAALYALEPTPMTRLADLMALRVARRQNDLIDVELQAMLKAEGYDPDRLSSYAHPAGLDHLINGDVDVVPGYRISVPFEAMFAGVKVKAIYPATYGIDFYGDSLFVSRDKVSNDPKLVERFKRASLKGWQYALQHPDEISRLIAERLPRTAPLAGDFVSFNRFQSEALTDLTLYKHVPLGQLNPQRWRQMHAQLKQLGLVSGEFKPLDVVFDLGDIQEVRSRHLLILFIIGISALLILVVIFYLWSATLQRQVSLRTKQFRDSERRYQGVFESSEVAIWNQDFSRVYDALGELRNEGVTDLNSYLAADNARIWALVERLCTVDVNPATLRLLGAGSQEELLARVAELYDEKTPQLFAEQFVAIWEQQPLYRAEHQIRTLHGEPASVMVSFPIAQDRDTARSVAITLVDLTEHNRREARLRTLYQAVEQSPVSVMVTDPLGTIEFINGTFEQRSGYSTRELLGSSVIDLYSQARSHVSLKEVLASLRAHAHWEGEIENINKSGDVVWESLKVSPVTSASGEVSHYLILNEDITLRKAYEDRILYQARFDQLTGLPNRLNMLEKLRSLREDAARQKQSLAVLFLDLDDFKKVNDTLGHEFGDKVLLKAAQRLRSTVGEAQIVGRLGGDEFIILLRNDCATEGMQPLLERLLAAFQHPFVLDQREVTLTASIGVATYPENGRSCSELLRNADAAMYYSKRQGRNTYTFFNHNMGKEVYQRLLLEEQMLGALSRGEFELHFQPQVCLVSGKMSGAEALLRWTNPVLGAVGPDLFIPVAEESGQIVPIGKFVITEALSAAHAWQQQGLDLRVAVNLSPRQFRDENLTQFILDELNRFELAASVLELEITEGLLLSGHSGVLDALTQLSDAGVSIAMDDFGTGYSSLSYLRRYPFDLVKIDRSFIRDLMLDSADQELVSAAISMAHGLGLSVLAEGVETEAQWARLKAMGCDAIQGFVFSKPVPKDALLQLALASNTAPRKKADRLQTTDE
ncbi:EAL domain-containing protein [Neptunomonas sp. XY-337]|uniref:EAL domain-containing protein n=1 Tax=Neptunomonas sp. XY-337 TaxID=2561897 RepID=UPI0010AB2AE3|nr:EAL domain-containing protein [Neptunomonas sp. XY-337]